MPSSSLSSSSSSSTTTTPRSSSSDEISPLLGGLHFVRDYSSDNEQRKNMMFWTLFLSAACVVMSSVYYVVVSTSTGAGGISSGRSGGPLLSSSMMRYHHPPLRASSELSEYEEMWDGATVAEKKKKLLLLLSKLELEEVGWNETTEKKKKMSTSTSSSSSSSSSPYSKVQALSFQIYTGGAPAFVMDETTGKEVKNHECKGLHSYGQPEDTEKLHCYLGLEDTSRDVQRRLDIMINAVDRAHDLSDRDPSTLKIFLAPEFYFRGVDGAFQFKTEEEEAKEEAEGEWCSDICHILKGLENIAAQSRFEDWLFLFGTVIANEALPREDEFDYQFYNFAPLYRGFDPAKFPHNDDDDDDDGGGRRRSSRMGKNFIVPKRYVSNMDFLTPLRHLTNKTVVMELLDEENRTLDRTLMNPHASGHKRYDNDIWARYKDELATLGYTMIEYGWFFVDGISFSVEICLDHLVRRALMTYTADVVTGSRVRVPSSSSSSSSTNEKNGSSSPGVVEWVGIPGRQAQVSLVSSAGMDVSVASLALADGGHVFLQDGMEGDVSPHSTYGTDDCLPNEYEFHGGSQSVKRTAVISATDVTFEYEMNMNFENHQLYPDVVGPRHWKNVLKGVFSSAAYPPKLTVYDPVDIAD